MRGEFVLPPILHAPTATSERENGKLRGRVARLVLLTGALAALATLSLAAAAKAGEPAPLDGAQVSSVKGGVAYAVPLAPSEPRRAVEIMVEGGGVRAPHGYERFCNQDPRYCAPPKRRRPGALVTANRELIDRLDAFNRSVNAEFTPSEDRAIYGVSDHWTFPSRYADCEDYVLIKQSRLLKAGWPRESLLIGVVVGEESPFHAVLIVRTSKGELVLDNMTDELRDWRDTGYTWVIRQSTQHPERWVQILDNASADLARR